MQKVIVLTGPTAVGKTKCSIELAKRLNTCLINGDAYQVYQDMNIGTAKPTKEELALVKHYLIDIKKPCEEFSVAEYQALVRDKITTIASEGKIPFIVGGSGLYIESVICNYDFSSESRDLEFEGRYKDYSNEELFELLKSLNPLLAEKNHPNNRKRVLRAIEISMEGNYTSRTLKNELLYDALVIFLNDDREVLYNRINSRVDEMINNGLIDEVKSFYPDKLSKTSKAAIGYKELFTYFDGNMSLDETIDKIKQASRNYAKRQLTWFRNKDYVKIVNIDSVCIENTINELEVLINDFLKR